jgi:CRISPR-associated protein Csd1
MLKALYDYGINHHLALPPGFVNKTVKAYIQIDTRSDYVGVFLNDDEPISCPDIGSAAQSPDKCNVLVEKRSVVLPGEPSAKGTFFLEALRAASFSVPELALCVKVLETHEAMADIRRELDQNKIKPSDRISFMVDGVPVVKLPGVPEWWQDFRKQFQTANMAEMTRCLITGEMTVPVATTAKIQGLRVVGGHSSGDALICFDKPAFQSYDLKKAANAPVSEEAFSAVKAALDDLLKEAPVLAGMKFVHWYDRDIPPEDDLFQQLGFGGESEDDEPETEVDREQRERNARRKADALVQNIQDGAATTYDLRHTSYYILMLTGVNSRIMIRRFERGNYEQLREKLELWRNDLSLTNGVGTAPIRNCKLVARLMRLLKYQKSDSRPFDRLDKELSGVTPAIVTAILTGGPLPDSVGARALAYIRSKILSADNDDALSAIPDGIACQWLKVWLLRKNRQEGFLMENYNMSPTKHSAYHCGGIMAVYAAIQKDAMGDVNAGVVERYYASAIQTPALVMGQLSRLSQYHIDKIREKDKSRAGKHAGVYQRYLKQLYTMLGEDIPTALSLPEQSYFALGYYQMFAKMSEDIATAKKQRETAAAENMEG